MFTTSLEKKHQPPVAIDSYDLMYSGLQFFNVLIATDTGNRWYQPLQGLLCSTVVPITCYDH